ncbi:MAG: hypothetical protein HEP71_31835 [Roseivirga sp.]|nr:hypothetical protein [Roseivirga sp.]
MNKSDKEIDELIHQALTKEEAIYFDQMGEQNISQQLFGLLKGKNSWMNWVVIIMHLVVLGVAIWTFTNMLETDVVGDKLEWMFYTIACFLVMVMLKLWGWNQMDKNVVLREVKRLEYQISLLKQQEK